MSTHKFNPTHFIDFYKTGHRIQYPEGTELVVSNFTPRSGKHANVPNKDEVVFFGLQYFLTDYLQDHFNEGFFKRPKAEVIAETKHRMDSSLGEGAVTLEHLEALHELGYLPLEVRALPEGAVVPVGIPLVTMHNTKPEFFWLTNFLETIMSAYLWLPITSATTARNYRRLLQYMAWTTGAPEWFTDYQAHDFSFRGMSSPQSALTSGAGHLLYFKGTDTVPAIDFAAHYYPPKDATQMIGTSVPATEHSVMCMGGEQDELSTFRRLIVNTYPKGIVSIVSDTWDFWQVLSEYSLLLHREIMSREGKVVFRPDSGDPVKIICGDSTAPAGSPENKGAVQVLWEIFGGTETTKGFKQLDEHVGLIYGDSITIARAEEILRGLASKGFASSNVVFGVGSFTYQMATRDTWGCAIKATYGIVKGEPRVIYKDPKTDDGIKKSARGLLHVARDTYLLTQDVSWGEFTSESNALVPVWRDGNLLVQHGFDEVRARATAVL